VTQILEIFFDLAVGWVFALIGILGLVGTFLSSVLSVIYLTLRREIFSAVPIILALGIVIAVGTELIPNTFFIGPISAIIAAVLTLRAHGIRANDGSKDWFDRFMMVFAAAALVSVAVPLVVFLVLVFLNG